MQDTQRMLENHYRKSNLLNFLPAILSNTSYTMPTFVWFQKAFWFFARLYDALTILVDFFNANDKGLSMDKINNQQYQVNWPANSIL